MKKLILSIATVCIMAFSPFIANAKNSSAPVTQTTSTGDTTGLHKLINRMEEIKTMDRSNLSFKEKKALRKELRDINGKLKAMDYIYISAGTLLLIIILLIIFL